MRYDASKPRSNAGVRGGRELLPRSTGLKPIQALLPAALVATLAQPSKRSKACSDGGFDGARGISVSVPSAVLMALSSLLPQPSNAPQNQGNA